MEEVVYRDSGYPVFVRNLISGKELTLSIAHGQTVASAGGAEKNEFNRSSLRSH